MASNDLLTTQQAARLLGCSRQHVVDLCTSGRLPHTRIGTHRRIRRGDLEAFTTARPLRREELRSLWLHRAVAGKVVLDPDRAIATARRNVERFKAIQPRAAVWLEAWRRILDEGPDAVLDALTSPSREAVELRQNTPFVGLLTDEEQRAVISAFTNAHRDRWIAAAVGADGRHSASPSVGPRRRPLARAALIPRLSRRGGRFVGRS